MADVHERVPLDGSLATAAAPALRDEQVLDTDEMLAPPLPALSAEERELLLLVLHEAPIDVDVSSGGVNNVDVDKDDGGSEKIHGRGVNVAHIEADSEEQDGGRELKSKQSAEKERTSGVMSARKGSVSEIQESQQQQPEQQEKVVKVNPRRNRKRRKHEVDALRVEKKELVEKLQQLQFQQQQVALAGVSNTQGNDKLVATSVNFQDEQAGVSQSGQQPSQWIVIKKGNNNGASPLPSLAATTSIWESLAWFQREEACTAMNENLRLKSLYQQQLQMLQRLEVMYNIPQSALHGELSYWQQDFSEGALMKRVRVDPFDADFAIFGSLGHDFDAQYLKTDSILASAGLTNFDGRMRQEMVPRRGENGIYFLESVFSKMIPRDMHELDERIWSVLSNEQLHSHHGLYEVRDHTNDTMFRKIVNTILLPHSEVTLTRRTATKRYIEAHRIVLVWDTVLEVSGSVSTRLRERGWTQMRRPHVIPAYHTGGPLSVEQSCVRITPELSTTYSEQDIATGSLANTVVSSYRQHLRSMHHRSRDVFIAMFGKMSIHGPCHKHRHKNCPTAAADSAPPPRPCFVAL